MLEVCLQARSQLKAEVEELLKQTEEADHSELPDGLDILVELKRREKRLSAIVEAKTEIERRAAECHVKEQAEYGKN
ncbi:hypothetical protein [uncultured Desulfuromusa sp.]|uniref:hypothetical protein n=1 Tax=uncultured Desulfuromusa sp. TaxID=219183 RepID=UPI002AA891A7|nr:hypothetical protein [uncultured Desulfuromusa sp.]